MQLSTKVCHILTKKKHFPPFPFPFFLLFHFVPPLFPFPSFLLLYFVPQWLIFHFFPRHQPPNHSILQNIYPYNVCFYWCIFQDIRRPLQTTLSVRSSVKPIPIWPIASWASLLLVVLILNYMYTVISDWQMRSEGLDLISWWLDTHSRHICSISLDMPIIWFK